MPHLLNFIGCQNILVDVAGSQITLVGIGPAVQPLGAREPDSDSDDLIARSRFVLAPMYLFAQWFAKDDDPEGTEFEQRVSIVAPDERESPLVNSETRWHFAAPFHAVLTQTGLITARMPGLFRFRLSLRRAGLDDWEVVTEYPFILVEPAVQQPPIETGVQEQATAPDQEQRPPEAPPRPERPSQAPAVSADTSGSADSSRQP